MKCTDCSFYWKEDGEKYPCCHFDQWSGGLDIPSPCEEEDEYYDN